MNQPERTVSARPTTGHGRLATGRPGTTRPMTLTRRELLARGSALAGGAALLALPQWAGRAGASAPAPSRLPAPASSGIDHIVVVMMENRSFDHFLGWLPGADGRQAGLGVRRHARASRTRPTTSPSSRAAAHPDPDHSWEGGRVEYDNGACDGWLRAGDERRVRDRLLHGRRPPVLRQGGAVLDGVRPLLRRDHGRDLSEPLLPARGADRPPAQQRRPDDLDAADDLGPARRRAGRTGRYYFSDVPFTALVGREVPVDQRTDRPTSSPTARPGRCPTSSYVDPRFLDEGSGTSGDDHPHADIRVGQHFLSSIYHAVTTSPAWARTVLVITYDEWGGFFDHVPPPVAPDANPNARLRGFRVPCIVVSPRARRRLRRAQRLRPHVDPQDDRVALRPRAAHDARRARAQPRRGPRLRARAEPRRARTGTCRPRSVSRASPGDPADYEGWKALADRALATGWSLT